LKRRSIIKKDLLAQVSSVPHTQKKGERKVSKVFCSICKSSGRITSSKQRKCLSCKGNGWVQKANGELNLCPKCNGDGIADYTTKCKECDGLGFKARIVEVFKKEEECGSCQGKGHKTTRYACRDCFGTRFISVLLSNGKRETKRCNCSNKPQHITVSCDICLGAGIVQVIEELNITPQK